MSNNEEELKKIRDDLADHLAELSELETQAKRVAPDSVEAVEEDAEIQATDSLKSTLENIYSSAVISKKTMEKERVTRIWPH